MILKQKKKFFFWEKIFFSDLEFFFFFFQILRILQILKAPMGALRIGPKNDFSKNVKVENFTKKLKKKIFFSRIDFFCRKGSNFCYKTILGPTMAKIKFLVRLLWEP